MLAFEQLQHVLHVQDLARAREQLTGRSAFHLGATVSAELAGDRFATRCSFVGTE
jgi:hypothetical protein